MLKSELYEFEEYYVVRDAFMPLPLQGCNWIKVLKMKDNGDLYYHVSEKFLLCERCGEEIEEEALFRVSRKEVVNRFLENVQKFVDMHKECGPEKLLVRKVNELVERDGGKENGNDEK